MFPKELLHRRVVLRATRAAAADDDRHAAETRKQVLQTLRQVHLVAGLRHVAEEARERVVGIAGREAGAEADLGAVPVEVREFPLDGVVDDRRQGVDHQAHIADLKEGGPVEVVPLQTLRLQLVDLRVVAADEAGAKNDHAPGLVLFDHSELHIVLALVGLFGSVGVDVDAVHALEERGQDRDVARGFGLLGSGSLGH